MERLEGMPFERYLSDPAPEPSLTSSILRVLADSAPAKVWATNTRLNPRAETPAASARMDIGTAAHAAFVGGNDALRVIDADSYRTKAAREARDEARESGLTPVLSKDHEMAETMAGAAVEFCEEAGMEGLLAGTRETTLLWTERSPAWREVYCRARPDILLDGDAAKPVIVHFKTTASNVHLRNMPRFAVGQNWPLIAAHYAAAWPDQSVWQVFLVQETTPPYLCQAVTLDEAFLDIARAQREALVDVWARCIENESWPGHEEAIHRILPPAWYQDGAEASGYAYRVGRQEMASRVANIPSTNANWKDWQAPL